MPTSRPAAAPSKWRFSLKTLFLLMFLAAVVAWLTSWRMWDLDERIILGSWFIATVSAIWWSRRRGQRGVLICVVAGGLVPSIAVLPAYVASLGESVPGIIFTTILGALAGGIAAMSLTPRGLFELPPIRRDDVAFQRLCLVTTAVLLAMISAGIWRTVKRRSVWRERGFLARVTKDDNSDLELAVTPNGARIASFCSARSSRRDGVLRVWDVDSKDASPLFEIERGDVVRLRFSNDGLQLKVHVSGLRNGVQVLDALSGIEIGFELHGNSAKPRERPDARERDHWATSSDGNWGIEVAEETNSIGRFEGYAVSVVNIATGQTQYSLGRFDDPFPIQFFPTNDRLAVNRTHLDLKTGQATQLPAEIHAFAADGARIVGVEEFNPYYDRPRWLEESFCRFPLVRHAWLQGSYARIVVLDGKTCAPIRYSQWIPGSISRRQLICSESGNVAIGVFITGNAFSVWNVPD